MPIVPQDARPVRAAAGLSAEIVGRDFALHDGRSGKVHFLNRTGALVWDLADGSRSVGQILNELASAFGRTPDELQVDVERILLELQGEGLIELAPPG